MAAKTPSAPKANEFAELIREVRQLVESARRAASTAVNTLQVLTNFEIGRRIVEQEQKGKARAEYGKALLKDLSGQLSVEFGKGFSSTNLKWMRQLFLEYSSRIGQKPSDQLVHPSILQKTSAKSTGRTAVEVSNPVAKPFTLSWSHYVLLLSIKNPDERSFYEIEATTEGWSLPELKRQVASGLYERLALSRNKKKVKELAVKGQIVSRPEEALKEPYVLEFLGLDERSSFSESDLDILPQLRHSSTHSTYSVTTLQSSHTGGGPGGLVIRRAAPGHRPVWADGGTPNAVDRRVQAPRRWVQGSAQDPWSGYRGPTAPVNQAKRSLGRKSLAQRSWRKEDGR